MKKQIKKLAIPYSKELGIDINTKQGRFEWFLASFLFGKRISETIAKNTFKEFKKRKVLTPDKILKTGWHKLVEILDAGGYVRYDYSTADRLLEISKTIKNKYRNLDKLHEQASDPNDLENKLKEFKGIGPTTSNIFLRELRVVWKKADPEPSQRVKETAKKLKIALPLNRKTKKFICLEAALIRLSKLLKK